MKISVIGNYLPRQCGIATFTHNFVDSVKAAFAEKSESCDIFVVAVNDKNQQYAYPDTVRCTIRQNHPGDYLRAAAFINRSGAGICVLQHEFGIFGGESGVLILSLIQHLNIPFIVIFHTVLKNPSYHEKAILKKLGERALQVVVMSDLAIDFLQIIYGVPKGKIIKVHHGVPDFGPAKKLSQNQQYNKAGKALLCTFGLLGRNKGIETVIHALPKVVEKHPEVLYVVLGKTHPQVKKQNGEEYRDCLKNLVAKNGLHEHVIFQDEFLEEEALRNFLLGVDIYITPYLNEAQITSGTLAYAVGSGTCIVSTPYWHARELLAEGRGSLFNFGDYHRLAELLNELLDDPEKRTAISEAAFQYGKSMAWKEIGRHYHFLLQGPHSQSEPDHWNALPDLRLIPKFSLDHVIRMTDSSGMLEHSLYSVAKLTEGYSLDDNARALLMVSMAYVIEREEEAIRLADIFMRYIHLMQKPDGSFHNELSYDRIYLDKKGSEDAFGRTIWSMGHLIRTSPKESYFQFALNTFFRAFPHLEKLQSNRGMANAVIGLCHFLKRYPDNEKVMRLLYKMTQKIREHFHDESDDQWRWFEPILCYDNAIIPLALWHSYLVTRDPETLMVAREATDFLDREATVDGHISLVGNDLWYKKGQRKARFGQQPINAMAMVMMFQQAFRVTGDEKYFRRMFAAFTWFLGNNDLFIPLYDEESKGCCDGIERLGVNRNQGAESIISYLLAYLTVKGELLEKIEY